MQIGTEILLSSPKCKNVSMDSKGNVSYFPSKTAKKAKTVTYQEYVGNEFKRLGTDIIEKMNTCEENMEKELVITLGSERRDFARAYRSQDVYSCMSDSIVLELDVHPCETYASGDFEILCLWGGGDLLSRCLCNKKEKVRNKIYSNQESDVWVHGLGEFGAYDRTISKAIAEQMAGILSAMGYSRRYSPFAGLKLLRIEAAPDELYMPFIDDCDVVAGIINRDHIFLSTDRPCYEEDPYLVTDGTGGIQVY